MELRLLGPVELWADGVPVPVGTAKQRCVLAVLALEANHVVPVETVIDRVWDQAPPEAARALVQTYVARLRRAFADCGMPAALTYRSGGYDQAAVCARGAGPGSQPRRARRDGDRPGLGRHPA